LEAIKTVQKKASGKISREIPNNQQLCSKIKINMKENVKLFESKKVRTAWNEQEEEWYFSVVDVVEVLTDSPNPRKYWSVLKTRLKQEGNETATNCSQLKMLMADGKMRLTDVANTEQILLHCTKAGRKQGAPDMLDFGQPKSIRSEKFNNDNKQQKLWHNLTPLPAIAA
jgi:hypothetical protein